MTIEDWQARWREGRIGFHQSETNPYLLQHHDVLPPAPSRILVPLCGKSLDLLWLRDRGHQVLGVELSEVGVQAFFDENQLTPERDAHGPFQRYRTEGIEILQGDFFALTPQLTGTVDGAFDRASVVALSRELRNQMAAALAALLPSGAPILLVSFDYPAHEMQPPPHSIGADEIHRLFDDSFDVEEIAAHDKLAAYPKFAEQGLTSLQERVFQITRRRA